MSDLAAGSSEPSCGSNEYNGRFGLRVAAIFVILATSLFGTLFPIVSRRVRSLHMPESLYEAVKYFGSGVIVATAFIHLLAPAFEELSAPCLTGTWTEYDWAPAIAMFSVFLIFIAELVAHRAGAAYLQRRGLSTHDPHSQGGNASSHTTHGVHIEESRPRLSEAGEVPASAQVDERDENEHEVAQVAGRRRDEEASITGSSSGSGSGSGAQSVPKESQKQRRKHDHAPGGGHHSPDGEDDIDEKSIAQIIGVIILELGVIFHSLIIGLTLAVDGNFVPLFVVIVFHQMFEGLGLGSRLSVLPLPKRFAWVPYSGAVLYSCITPLGLAIGLGVRTRYNPNSATASIVSGTLDALAAGILLYTGLVELLAHDFIFNRKMATEASNAKVTFAVSCVLTGAGLMALLGRWA